MRRNLPVYLAALMALILTPTAILAQSLGDSSVVTPIAAPGYPEGIATRGNRFYVSARQRSGSHSARLMSVPMTSRQAPSKPTIQSPSPIPSRE